MSGAIEGDFASLEKHRLELEDNIKQLQKALQHWQAWDAEYEALKEEVEEVGNGANQAEALKRIHDEFEGELLVGKEIDDVFGANSAKSRAQIVCILDRRIDYVTKNVSQLQKQLEIAENKFAAATVVNHADAGGEDGQPITEIVEELDDDDNVLSYRLNKAGETAQNVEKALGKVGVELPDGSAGFKKQQSDTRSSPNHIPNSHSNQRKAVLTSNDKAEEIPYTPKKGVSFTDDTKSGHEPPQPVISRTAKRVQQIMNNAKEQENMKGEAPIIPDDEDEEDAALRQEMLKYSMGDVGAVVAELQLEEGDVTDEDEEFDYIDEVFDEEEDEDEDDEDKYGRSKGRTVTDDYRQRMLELEQKLGITSRFTQNQPTAKEKDSDSDDDDDERLGRIVINHNASSSTSASKPTPRKSNIKDSSSGGSEGNGSRGVRFAESLDIASKEALTAPVIHEKGEKREKGTPVDPVGDVIERSVRTKAVEPTTTRKPSRFRKTKQDSEVVESIPRGPLEVPAKFLDQNVLETPSGPDGMTIADTLVERDPVPNPLAPDEMGDVTDYHEVAGEYQRMRKRFIQREGGFLKEDESPIQPLDESEGGPERMSRFKAARLSRQ